MFSSASNTSIPNSERRILLVSNRVMHYRVPVYNYFSRRFRDYGYEFSVLADRIDNRDQRRIEFDCTELPFGFRSYAQEIERQRPDMVILFLLLKDRITWPLIHWLKWKGLPFASWTKGSNWDNKGSRLRYHLFNYVHRLSSGLIVYSRECLDGIKPGLREKVFVANNTLNSADVPEITQSKEAIKEEFGIPFKKVVIFAGRMGAEKGRKRVDHLIDIFARLRRSDVGLVIVGPGMPEEFRVRINKANTLYLGEVHDPEDRKISKLFKCADVCAIPGHIGLGLNQAFLWGLPVVTEECEHPPEIAYLKPGQNGFIVPRNDLIALEEKILYLLDNDEIRADFSRSARAVIENEASIETMFSGFRSCADFIMNGCERGVQDRDCTLISR
jgi:glycosyltransferase involved in cell wall biosynthesis